MIKYKKFVIFGFLASLVLLGVYFLVLAIAESISHAYSQFLEMWYLVLILTTGFGIQFGLFIYIKEKQKVFSSKVLATSGGVSTGSMVACCLHHVTDVLPLMGLAAVAVFLTKYQTFFVILGILSNFVGITILLNILKKNPLTARLKMAAIVLSLIVLPVSFLSTPTPTINFLSQTGARGGISFEVIPLDFNFENPVKFEIKIDTHSGSLDFDLVDMSSLEDDLGNKYNPLEWQGSDSGGHHMSGVLTFSKIDKSVSKIKLIISGSSQQIFEWQI